MTSPDPNYHAGFILAGFAAQLQQELGHHPDMTAQDIIRRIGQRGQQLRETPYEPPTQQ
jgi:hypothetical protein